MPTGQVPDVRGRLELVCARRSRDQLRPRAERLVPEHRASPLGRPWDAAHGRQWGELDDHELHRRRRVRLSMERLAAVRRHVGLPHRPWRIASGDGGLPLRPHRREQPGRRSPRLSLRHDQHLQRLGERASKRQRFPRQHLFRSRDLLRLHALRRRRSRPQHGHADAQAQTTTRRPTANLMPRTSPPSAPFRRCGSTIRGRR